MSYTLFASATAADLAAKSDKYATSNKTTSFTAAPGNVYLVDTTSGVVTATLPAASVAGQSLVLKRVAGTNPVTVVRAGSDTIGAAAITADITLDNESWELVSSGSGQWNLTAGNKTLAALDARYLGAQAPVDHGVIAWSVPIDFATQQSAMSIEIGAGTLRLTRIRRVPPGNITNLIIYVNVGGSTLSNCFAALYSAAGSLLGQTADQSTNWQSLGPKVMPLVGGAVAVPAGDYYVGLWYNGTTAPTVQRSGTGVAGTQLNLGQAAADYNAAYANTGLTTTAPPTIGAKTSSALRFWVAVS